MLLLAALANGREVLISRGELVEIGGGFRVPDVMAQSGAILREVGTTNRTRIADFAAAISDRTALILRVHPSNFRIEGFTERPSLADLVSLGRRFNVPIAEDLGSGWFGWPDRADLPRPLADEPIVSDSIDQLILRVRDRLQVTTVVVTHDMRSARRVGQRLPHGPDRAARRLPVRPRHAPRR